MLTMEPTGELHAATLYATIDTCEHVTPYLLWGDAGIVWISAGFLVSFILAKLFPFFLRRWFKIEVKNRAYVT